MTLKIIDRKEGYDALRRTLFGGAPSQVLVGIQEEDGAEAHGRVTFIDVAVWTHMGTKNSPARPFLSGWFDKNKGTVEKWIVALMPSLTSGKRTKEQILDIIGLRIVGEIQKTMTGVGIPPANAASTIRKKGSSTATVEDGILRSKITHVVKKAT